MHRNLLGTDNKQAMWGGQDINEGNADHRAESHVVKWKGQRVVLGVGVSDQKGQQNYLVCLLVFWGRERHCLLTASQP